MALSVNKKLDTRLADPHLEGNFQFVPFDQARHAWRELAADAPETVIFQREEWLQLLCDVYGLRLHLACLREADQLRAACVLSQSRNPFNHRFISLPFSDACPPLFRDRSSLDELVSKLTASTPAQRGLEIRNLAAPPPWQVVNCFSGWELRLDRPIAALERSLAVNFKRNRRQGLQAGVKIERSQSLEAFKRFYKLQLDARRRLGLPAQPWRFFRRVHETFAANGSLDIWLACHDQQDQAAIVTVRDADRLYYKWGARRAETVRGAYHLLIWNTIEAFAGQAGIFDLGRTDVRNFGLCRFKQEMGGAPVPLPYSFFPAAPAQISAEVLTGSRKVLSQIWRHFPNALARILGDAIYRYLE